MAFGTRALTAGAAMAALTLAACDAQDAAEAPAAPEAAAPVETAACGRECLRGLVTEYLHALDDGDASVLPVTDSVRFTEDQQERAFGTEGVWAGDVELTDYRFDVIDVREGIAASLVKIVEDGAPALMALRLLTDDGTISGAETMVVRNAEEGMIYQIDAIQMISGQMSYTPTPQERNTREEMIAAAVRYPEGLKAGSFVTSDVPFAPEAYRFENGMLMAGPGCTFLEGCENIKEQRVPTLAGLTYSVSAVDEEQGVVLIRMDFGPGSIFPSPDRPDNQSLSVFEAFKVYGGQVHAVEAFMEMKPADQPLGWN